MHKPQDKDWLGRWKHVNVYTNFPSTYHVIPLNPQIVRNYFILLG